MGFKSSAICKNNLPNNFSIKSFSIPLFHEIAQGIKLIRFTNSQEQNTH